MFQQTPQKRVLFPRALTQFMAGGFVVFGLLILVLASLITAFSPPQMASAATNNTLSFQARLETASGAIVPDGFYNVEFNLYNASSGGSSLWTETYYDFNGVTAGSDNRVEVHNGYVSVNLGALTAFGGTIKWDQEHWITMNIGGTAQTATPTWDGEMNPRLKLTGVPYAFRAGQLATSHTSNGFTSTLSILQPTGGNQTFQIQDQGSAGTYNICVQNSTACGFAAATGGAGYIQNQSTAQQTSSTFWISGTGRSDTALQAPSFDTPTAVALNIGTTNATSIVLGKSGVNTRVAANLSVGTTQSLGAITIANGAWFTAVDSAGTGAVNMFSVNSSNQIQVGAALNIDGGIVLPTNGGQMTLVDLGIDSSASTGAKQSYTLRVGSSNALTVYGEADGSGNAQNVRVAVGSSITPAYTLDVGGDINTSGSLRTGGTDRVTSTGVLQNVTANTSILTAGTLGIARGGTGVATTPTNGQLLIGNGTGYSLGTIAVTGGLTVTNSAGGISLGTDSTICTTSGNCAGAGNGITGSGSTNTIALFTGSAVVGNSIMTQTGTTIDISGDLMASVVDANTFETNGTTRIDASGVLQNVTANANILTSGTLSSSVVSGSYTGITGVGTLTVGTWNATAIADAYVSDTLTVGTAGNVSWVALSSYPTGCSAGQAVTAVGDTLTCSTFATSDTNTTYSAGTDLDLTGTTFDIESQLDGVSTISRASSSLTLQTTTSGNIILNSAGTIELQDNTNITGALTVTGDVRTGNQNTISLTRTVPTTVGTAVDIGSFALFAGSAALSVDVTIPSSNFSVAKQYSVPLFWDGTANVWQFVQPLTDTNAFNGNDVTLEVLINNGTASLRLRRSAGTTAGTAYITITQQGLSTDVFTPSTSTAAVTAPTAYYNASIAGSSAGTFKVQGNLDVTNSGNLQVGGTTVITSGRVLQNVTASAGILTSGTVGSSLLTGSYTGITGVGTLTVGTWNATSIADAYIDDTLTVGTSGNVAWVALSSYPTGCSAGQAVTAVGDTLTCGTFATSDTNTTYTAGNDLDLTGTTFDIESQLDSVSTISRASSSLTLQTTTSGNIILNSAGTIELQDNTNVTGTLASTGNLAVGSGNAMSIIDLKSTINAQNVTGSERAYNQINFGNNFYNNARIAAVQPDTYFQDAAELTFSTAYGTMGERMRILAAGDVAIGATTSGGFRLNVQGGDINTSGNLRTGGTDRITATGVLQNVTASAGILTSGTVGSSLLTGSYAGITGVGTLTAGTWNATSIADAYIDDTLTVGTSGNVAWVALSSYPTGCSAGQAVTAVGDTLTCSTFATSDTNTTYSAGTDLDLTGTTFDIESQLDGVSTISRASSSLTLQTTTSGNIILNSAGTIELQDNTNITGNLTIGATNQQITFTTGAVNHGIEIGRIDSAASNPFIDLHSGSTAVDYDARIAATGGSGSSGGGTVNITAANTNVSANLQVAGQTVIDSSRVLQNVTANANILTTGTISSTVVSGTYSGITAVGTLTSLTASGVITSTVTTGTAPLTIASTTKVANLNVDLLDGLDSASFAAASGSGNYIQHNTSGTPQIANIQIQSSNTTIDTLALKAISTQSSDLLEMRDSGNVVVARFDVSGNLTANSVATATLQNAGTLSVSATGSNKVDFNTNGTLRWSVLSTGEFQGNGASTIKASSGDLSLQATDANGSILSKTSSTSLLVPVAKLIQGSTGDTTLEFNNTGLAKSFFIGMDTSSSGNFVINSSTAASNAGTPGTITHVQSSSTGALATSTTIVRAFGSNTTAGNLIVVGFSFDNAATPTVSCGDNQGNSYTTVVQVLDAGATQKAGVCYAPNVIGGSTTVTVTLSASSTNRSITISEYSGVMTSSPVDVFASNQTTGTTAANNVTSTAATTTRDNDLIYGFVAITGGSSTISAGTNFTQRTVYTATNPPVAAQDRILATAGSVASTNTIGTSRGYGSIMVAFKAAGSAITDNLAGPLFTMSQLGAATFVNSSNSATAFQIQNATGSGMLVVDTLNTHVCVNSASCTKTFGVTGTIGASGTITASTTPDIAETIAAADDVEAADVVMADPDNTERVVKASGAYSDAVVGVISDGSSSFMINSYGGDDDQLTGKPLVLAGRVPVKVTDEGGAIKPGDYLTVSSTPGYAMKATRAGSTVGKALGFFNGTTGTVLVLVNISYHDPAAGTTIQGSDLTLANLNVSGNTILQELTVTGNATVQGTLEVTGVTIVQKIVVNGHIMTNGLQPVVSVGAALGQPTITNGITIANTSPLATVDGNDSAGTLIVTSGSTSVTSGKLAEVVFAESFEGAYKVVVSATNSSASNLRVFVTKTSTGFELHSSDTLSATTEYQFDYIVLGAHMETASN